jgi:histidinol phosphatase-like enzyme
MKKLEDLKDELTGSMVKFKIEIGKGDILKKAFSVIKNVLCEVEMCIDGMRVVNDKEIDIVADREVKSKYSLEYLKHFVKSTNISKRVMLEFDNDYPTIMNYAGENHKLEWVLAPRVENE